MDNGNNNTEIQRWHSCQAGECRPTGSCPGDPDCECKSVVYDWSARLQAVHRLARTSVAYLKGMSPRETRSFLDDVEFEEYLPYVNMAQFEREIGKYVDENEVARLARYVYIEQ